MKKVILGLLLLLPAVAFAQPARSFIIFGKVAVTSSATQVGPFGSKSICFKVPAGGATVFLGDSTVTTSTGFPIAAGEAFCDEINLSDGRLYAITASSQDLHYLGSN